MPQWLRFGVLYRGISYLRTSNGASLRHMNAIAEFATSDKSSGQRIVSLHPHALCGVLEGLRHNAHPVSPMAASTLPRFAARRLKASTWDAVTVTGW